MVLGKPQTDPTLEWFLSHCHIHKYPSKSTLIHQGEKAETLYYIVKGSVAVLIKDEEGKEMILSYLNQGDFIGELGLFEEGQERSAWVRAKTACEVAEISYKKFRQLIQVNPDILMRLSAQMARRLQVTSEKVGNLAFLDVTGRIAQTLLNLAKHRPGDKVQVKVMRDKKEKNIEVTLKNEQGTTKIVKNADMDILGAAFRPVPDELKKQLNLGYGLEVTGVSNGKMAEGGVRKGFIILKVNNVPMKTVEDLEKVMKEAAKTQEQVLFITGMFPSGKRGSYAVSVAQD